MNEILARSPIDRVAYRVTLQKNVATVDAPIKRAEISFLRNRLERKMRLLKMVLGIKNKSQHRNTIKKVKMGLPQYRGAREPRALNEYIACGKALEKLETELSELRKLRQFVAAAEKEYKSMLVTD